MEVVALYFEYSVNSWNVQLEKKMWHIFNGIACWLFRFALLTLYVEQIDFGAVAAAAAVTFNEAKTTKEHSATQSDKC